MNPTLPRRLAVLTGLALAAALTLWWLGSTRLALERGSDAGRSAVETLHALWLVRGMALALFALRAGAARGWQAGAASGLALVAPSWPLVVLAWSASATPLVHVLAAEALLIAASASLPLLGQGLRRVLARGERADAVATAVGVALAAALWFSRGLWAGPPA